MTLKLVCALLCLTSGFLNAQDKPGRVWAKDPFVIQVPAPEKRVGKPVPKPITTVVQKKPMTLKLQGIWKSGGSFKAMLSNQIVSVGQKIDGYFVKDIQNNRIVLKGADGQGESTLRLEIKNE